jgi:hypothetical protein
MNPAWLAPPTAILVGLGIVMVIVGVTSRISGWSLLAEAYPCLDEVEGRRRWFASMGLRRWSFLPANYGGIVVLTFMPEGVRFSLLFPFRIMHPPLFIPWREFARTEVTTIFFRRQRSFWFGQTSVRMDVTLRLGDEILAVAREAGRNLG